MRPFALFVALILTVAITPATAQLRGHAGPVRAVAATPDGATAVSGGFDSSLIVWELARGRAREVLRWHKAPVTAVAAGPSGLFASGDQGGGIALFHLGDAEPRRIAAHEQSVSALAFSRDGARLASVGWDGRATLIDVASGEVRRLIEGGPKLAALALDEEGLILGGEAGVLLRLSWNGKPRGETALGAPISTLTRMGDATVAGLADGRVLRVADDGAVTPLFAMTAPVSALAAREGLVAAAAMDGAVRLSRDRRLSDLPAKAGRPVWSLALAGDELLAAGHDGFVRRFDLASGQELAPAAFAEEETLPEALKSHPGARVFEACRACHSLAPGERRAGPSLHGLMGRKIASAPGYDFSAALRAMDLIWDRESLSRLFEIGPAVFAPGTKMPDQRVPDPQDRAALAEFLTLAGQ